VVRFNQMTAVAFSDIRGFGLGFGGLWPLFWRSWPWPWHWPWGCGLVNITGAS